MTPEEYQRIKDAEKEHLKSLRKLKQAVRSMQRQNKVSEAMREMAEGGASALGDSSDAVDQLAMETAHNEAKLEVALDSVEAGLDAGSDVDAAKLAEAEEELRRERARELVRQLRGESSSTASTRTESSSAASTRTESSPAEPARGERANPNSEKEIQPLPEKTIGRMKP